MTQSPFVCGGPVGIGSSVYVTRAADTNAINATQKKEYISIFGPRQVGKTSLLHQIQASVESQYNYATAIIDLSSINDPSINFREWSRQLCNLIDDQIKPFVE